MVAATKILIRTASAIALALPFTAVSAVPTAPTVEQLAAYPAMSSVSVSPDGKHIVALQGKGEDRYILVWDADGLDKKPTVLASKHMKIQGVQFVKNDLLAVSMWQPYDARFDGVTKTFIGKLYITDLKGENWQEPLPQPRARSEIDQRLQAITSPQVLYTLPNDPDHILVINQIGANSGDVYRVNIRTNRAERIQRSDANVAGYITDNDGNLRARFKSEVDNDGAYISTQFRDVSSNSWDEHFRSYVKDRNQQEVVGFSPDPNIAYILSNVGKDKAYIYEYNIAEKKKGEILFQHKFFDATGVRTFQYTDSPTIKLGQLLGVRYAGPRGNDVYWTNPQMEAIDKQIRAVMKIKQKPVKFVDPATGDSATVDYDADVTVHINSYTPDFKTIIFVTEGSDQPPAYYMIRNGKLTSLAKAYPDIDPNALGRSELIYYKARDGLSIPAFLTKPKPELCGQGPWKAVVHPHGGPWARDDMGFDGSMWVPLMTSRCMAVLQPQYRGSDGWGRKLWTEGDAEWGKKMQDDKDDGAKWLIDQKIAQPGHIAMFGFSYGGYASMAAAVRPNGLYKCAIAGAGVSDIRRIWSRFYTNPFFRGAQAKTVDGLSPVDKADQIKIPIMVYHGERDQTVPIEQSRWFVDKAKKSDQKVVYHELKDYAHGPAWTRAIMAEQLGYIDDYFKNGCGGGGL